jgi:hypothetical protein
LPAEAVPSRSSLWHWQVATEDDPAWDGQGAGMAIKGRVIHVDGDTISVRLDIPYTEIRSHGDSILKIIAKRGIDWGCSRGR